MSRPHIKQTLAVNALTDRKRELASKSKAELLCSEKQVAPTKNPSFPREIKHKLQQATAVTDSMKFLLRRQVPDAIRRVIDLLDEGLALDKTSVECWYNRGNQYFKLADFYPTLDQRKYYDQAIQSYRHALSIDEGYANAWYNWGLTLTYLAQNAKDGHRAKLYQESIEKFECALELDPEHSLAMRRIGFAISCLCDDLPLTEHAPMIEKASQFMRNAKGLKSTVKLVV